MICIFLCYGVVISMFPVEIKPTRIQTVSALWRCYVSEKCFTSPRHNETSPTQWKEYYISKSLHVHFCNVCILRCNYEMVLTASVFNITWTHVAVTPRWFLCYYKPRHVRRRETSHTYPCALTQHAAIWFSSLILSVQPIYTR